MERPNYCANFGGGCDDEESGKMRNTKFLFLLLLDSIFYEFRMFWCSVYIHVTRKLRNWTEKESDAVSSYNDCLHDAMVDYC